MASLDIDYSNYISDIKISTLNLLNVVDSYGDEW